MTALSRPQHPAVVAALRLAGAWCGGHLIDDVPAIAHAVDVARALERHHPRVPGEVVAASLLHDAPAFAPVHVDLDAELAAIHPVVPRIVRQLDQERAALIMRRPAVVEFGDPWAVRISAADKIARLRSTFGRARTAADQAAYWDERAELLDLVPCFVDLHVRSGRWLPRPMHDELGQLLARAVRVAARHGTTAAPPAVNGCPPMVSHRISATVATES